MRLSTLTNWAYGATLVLTLASGATMLLASNAQEVERAAVAQRYRFDGAAAEMVDDAYVLSNQARQFAVTGGPANLILYENEARRLRSIEARIGHMRDLGAKPDELTALASALRWMDSLKDDQRAAIEARKGGDKAGALGIVFGSEYERDLDRAAAMIERFEYRLEQRTEDEVAAAEKMTRLWRATSESVLALTGVLFLCVLYFILKRRILRPVVRLSDVVNRLAAQDFAAELPALDQIDEIGDMALAIRGFRENAIERIRLEQERETDRHVRDLLSRMTQRMQGADSLPVLAHVIERFAPEIAPDFSGRLFLRDEARNAMGELCQWSAPRASKTDFAPTDCWAIRRGALHRPAGAAIDLPCEHFDQTEACQMDTICLPLNAQNEILGMLCLERRVEAGSTRETPEVYLQVLAENVGLALSNLKLRERLHAMAMADPLTGLANRRQMDSLLDCHLADAESQGRPISCLMLDVDHFKRFNDEFGHDAGDAVLREVADTLRKTTRDPSLVCRYGGEEFLVLLPGFEPGQAIERAELIRERIAGLRLRHADQSLGSITASIGVASLPDHATADRLVPTADAALLRAKAAGRDRVVCSTVRAAQQLIA